MTSTHLPGNFSLVPRLRFPRRRPISSDVEQDFETLQAAVHQRTPVMMISTEVDTAHTGHLLSAAKESMTLEVQDERARFVPGGLLCVTFALEGHSHAFFSYVKRYQPEDGTLAIIPQGKLTRAESRSAYRAPVHRSAPLEAFVTCHEGRMRAAHVYDLSFTGVQLSLMEGGQLPKNTEVLVELNLEGLCLELRGEVRREMGKRYGIFFPDCVLSGRPSPTPKLREMVKKIEAIWRAR